MYPNQSSLFIFFIKNNIFIEIVINKMVRDFETHWAMNFVPRAKVFYLKTNRTLYRKIILVVLTTSTTNLYQTFMWKNIRTYV